MCVSQASVVGIAPWCSHAIAWKYGNSDIDDTMLTCNVGFHALMTFPLVINAHFSALGILTRIAECASGNCGKQNKIIITLTVENIV